LVYVPSTGAGIIITGSDPLGVAIQGNNFGYNPANSSPGTGTAIIIGTGVNDGVISGNSFGSLAVGINLNSGTSGWNVLGNIYPSTGTPVSNSGSNSIGVATP
jgi:hypothetical protein